MAPDIERQRPGIVVTDIGRLLTNVVVNKIISKTAVLAVPHNVYSLAGGRSRDLCCRLETLECAFKTMSRMGGEERSRRDLASHLASRGRLGL